MSLPRNWPPGFRYAPTSVYEDVSAHFFRHLLVSPDPASQNRIAPCIEERRVHPLLSIQKIEKPHPLAGQFGVFAQGKIPAGAELGEYAGIVSFGQRKEKRPFKGVHCWRVPFGQAVFHVASDEVANELAFINDFRGLQERPNVRTTWILHRGSYYFGFETIREIEPMEELLVDYGKTWATKWENA